MTHLVRIGSRYYYNRRVPEIYQPYDPRALVRIALRTDSKQQAYRRAVMLNDQVEAYWQSLVANGLSHNEQNFKNAVTTARQMGFTYQPISVVASLPREELIARLLALKDASKSQVEAVLGTRPDMSITLKEAIEKYWALAKDKLVNKSEFQIRKWKNPRRKAVENFISVVGNKPLTEISRDDIIAFRDWWLDKIKEQKKSPDTANKNLIQLRTIIETLTTHYKLEIDVTHLFKRVLLKAPSKRTRRPFTSQEIINILEHPVLERTHPEIRYFLMIMAETGARPNEIVALRSEDIKLEEAIPHICIVDRGQDESLKTGYSERIIPLAGYALQALQQLPGGFSHYRNKSDILTTAANKFLRSKGLLPTPKHTVYSLRHSFQDRLLLVNTPDRIQCDLMGHKFNRPVYGNGATVKQKADWLDRIRLMENEL